jgi:hypothetical protein
VRKRAFQAANLESGHTGRKPVTVS